MEGLFLMGGRKWTDEELVLLEELTEKYPLETVARRLNRTKEAVFLKRQRIGIGGYMANTDMLTRNSVSKILGIENRTLQYWERKGLKSYRKEFENSNNQEPPSMAVLNFSRYSLLSVYS